jgi:molecular chaperone HtpG
MSESTPGVQTHSFKAGIAQLLDILVHSVYTSKEIFVRELVSNASDALEKLRFLQVRGDEIHDPERPLEIRIETKHEDGRPVLVISDSGIGMTADEVRENIGTIAQSGARAFMENFDAGGEKSLELIGRFGIGFYSVFMAAERVVLTSRSHRPDAAPVVWESDGREGYTLRETSDDVPRGTRIEIFLRDDEARFAEEETINAAVDRSSSFIAFPLFVNGAKRERLGAIWREQPSHVNEETYEEFYRFVTHEAGEPRRRLHVNVDTPIHFAALLFVPQTNPEALGFGEREVAVQLYAKRVLIDPENKEVLPRYLRFVRGVVESDDLPLNISRETLQENAVLRKIRDVLTRKLLDDLQRFAKNDEEGYAELWRTFGRILKEGYADFQWRERWQELLRFSSSSQDDDDGLTSLAAYVERMPEKQPAIYYLSGPSRDALDRDPRLELFRKKDLEVLYLTDVADEIVLGSLGEYHDKKLVSADQVQPADLEPLADVERDDAEEKSDDDASAASRPELDALISSLKATLGDRISGVRLSERLVSSPACLVNDSGVSAQMDRLMRMVQKTEELPQRLLEINPKHPLVAHLAKLAARDAHDAFVRRAAEQIFESAMLLDGYLTDPHRLVERINETLTDAAAARASAENED